MTENLTGRTLDELTALVEENIREAGLTGIDFVIRPLHYEMRNWYIDVELSTAPLSADDANALDALGADLRRKHYLFLKERPSPFAA